MMTFGEKLALAREAKKMNRSELARVIGLTPQRITQIENGTGEMKVEPFLKSLDVLGVSVDHFIEGSKYSAPLVIAKDAATFHVFDVHAACGNGYQNGDYPDVVRTIVMSPEEAINRIGSVNKSGSIKVIVARGDSMTPTIAPDDLLFVDTAISEYTCEGIYILLHDRQVVCKRLSKAGRTLTVSSDNKKTPSWAWDDRLEQDRIIGRVLCALPIKIRKF